MSETRVYDLLAEWEECRQAGKNVTAEQLCPDDLVLQAELEMRIRRQEQVRQFIEPNAKSESLATFPSLEGYEILDVVGSGGMGVVYRARHNKLDRVVAVKMLLGGSLDQQRLDRFRDEAKAVAALQHPNIVQVFESGETNHQPFFVLEFISGGSLAQQLRGTPIGSRQAAELVLVLARAIQHAHERGILHRDLKPANVMMMPDGTPKITDFGLAKRLDDDSARTQAGAIMGTPSYMPPEQASGDAKRVGPATDVYSLGAILYELLTGRPPFRGETMLETIRQVNEHPPVEPRALQPGISRDLEVICLKCLEKRTEDRYESAAALAEDLTRFLAGDPIHAKPRSVFDVVAQNLKRGNFHPGFQVVAKRLLVLAPVPLVAHLAAFFTLRDQSTYHVMMTSLSLIVLVVTNWIVMMGLQSSAQLVPSAQRRHFYTVWCSEIVTTVLIWLVVWTLVPQERPELMFLVYPLWCVNVAKSYLSFAADAGWMYIHAGLFFCLAILFTFALPWAPLILAGLMFVNMTFSALMIRFGIGVQRDTVTADLSLANDYPPSEAIAGTAAYVDPSLTKTPAK